MQKLAVSLLVWKPVVLLVCWLFWLRAHIIANGCSLCWKNYIAH